MTPKIQALPLLLLLLLVPSLALAEVGPLPTVQSFAFDCTTSIQRIKPASGALSGGYASIYCSNSNAGPVAWGGSDVSLTTAPDICNDAACLRPDFSANAMPYCIAGSTIEILCVAGK